MVSGWAHPLGARPAFNSAYDEKLRNSEPGAKIGRLHSRFMLHQNTYDLYFVESALLHPNFLPSALQENSGFIGRVFRGRSAEIELHRSWRIQCSSVPLLIVPLSAQVSGSRGSRLRRKRCHSIDRRSCG